MLYEKTASRFRSILNERGITQQELADKSGVAKASISHYLNGRNCPSNKTAYMLANVLKCDPAWLMGFDTDMSKAERLKEFSEEAAIEDAELLKSYHCLCERDRAIIKNMIASMIKN